MLSDTKCKNAKPKDKSYKIYDSNGLFLEIMPAGQKTPKGSKLYFNQ